MNVTKFGRTFKIKFWDGEILSNYIALDTETTFETNPAIFPSLVLTTVYDGSDSVYIVKNYDLNYFFRCQQNKQLGFCNAAFDIPVIEKTDAYNFHLDLMQNRIDDLQILWRLYSLATTGDEAKGWSLDKIVLALFGEILEKNEDIRFTFGQYLEPSGHVRYDDISLAHYQYAVLDSIATKLCLDIILKKINELPTSTKLSQKINLLGDIALAQVHRNGIGVNLPYVEQIKQKFEEMKKNNAEILATYGYVRGKKGNTKVLENIIKTEKFDLPLTETNKFQATKETLKPYAQHPFIKAYLEFKGFEKQNNFLKLLNSSRVHPWYNSIKRTSRSSCSNPNLQQMPRIGGIRECFIPEPGNVFVIVDYSAIELAAIADICLKLVKESKMADLLNAGKCPHKYSASNIYKIPETEVVKEQRQLAKALNFGLVANMSPETFVGQAAKYGVTVTADEGNILKKQWSEIFPEMKKYWKRGYGRTTCITDTGFIRANCSYTEYLNLPMQLKVAEGAKLALYFLWRAGHKVVGFVHDECIIECKESEGQEVLEKVSKIMIEAMSLVITKVKVNVEGGIKTCFSK